MHKIEPLSGIRDDSENTALNKLQETCIALKNERDELLAGIKALYAGFLQTVTAARQVLIESGYPCDPLEVYENKNPALKAARDLIAKIEG